MKPLRVKGKAININHHLVGKVTRSVTTVDESTFLLLDEEPKANLPSEVLGILTCEVTYQHSDNSSVVYKIPRLDHLDDGDIVSVGSDGNINTLYRVNSFHNTLLATERCNSNCLMCSQPPRDRNDIEILHTIHKKLIPLIPKDCPELGISGGEPTLLGDKFFELLFLIQSELPNTEVHVLTNGRSFAWNDLAKRLGEMNFGRLMLGIPLYSDYYQIHDYTVQAEHAFYQTMIGLHNLSRYNIRLEIRVVLHKQTIPRLSKLARYIYKNLPFVEHITFMGLEYIGYTPHNISKLWVDPYHYQNELSEAVTYLSDKGMHVSIYNTPLCLLPRPIWPFARKSISDWKNDYLPECKKCEKLDECGGLFVWNLKKHSDYIHPIVDLPSTSTEHHITQS